MYQDVTVKVCNLAPINHHIPHWGGQTKERRKKKKGKEKNVALYLACC